MCLDLFLKEEHSLHVVFININCQFIVQNLRIFNFDSAFLVNRVGLKLLFGYANNPTPEYDEKNRRKSNKKL